MSQTLPLHRGVGRVRLRAEVAAVPTCGCFQGPPRSTRPRGHLTQEPYSGGPWTLGHSSSDFHRPVESGRCLSAGAEALQRLRSQRRRRRRSLTGEKHRPVRRLRRSRLCCAAVLLRSPVSTSAEAMQCPLDSPSALPPTLFTPGRSSHLPQTVAERKRMFALPEAKGRRPVYVSSRGVGG